MRLLRPWIGTCEETADCLSDHLEHTLEPSAERRVRRHLAWCPGCRSLFASLTRAVDGVRALGTADEEREPPSVADAVLERIRHDQA